MKIGKHIRPDTGSSDLKQWDRIMKPIMADMSDLGMRVAKLRAATLVIPSKKDTFRAFELTQPENLKVILVGQDPYPKYGQPTGVAFGVDIERSKTVPFSLKMILEEVENTTGVLQLDPDHTLEPWCRQGVLMLNTAFTLEAGRIGSHTEMWRPFTERLLTAITKEYPDVPVIFLGSKAAAFEKCLNGNPVLKASHPAAEAYGRRGGFLKSGIFSKCNIVLEEQGKEPIDWNLHESV
jgi:uracil-DNA glycosylase